MNECLKCGQPTRSDYCYQCAPKAAAERLRERAAKLKSESRNRVTFFEWLKDQGDMALLVNVAMNDATWPRDSYSLSGLRMHVKKVADVREVHELLGIAWKRYERAIWADLKPAGAVCDVCGAKKSRAASMCATCARQQSPLLNPEYRKYGLNRRVQALRDNKILADQFRALLRAEGVDEKAFIRGLRLQDRSGK